MLPVLILGQGCRDNLCCKANTMICCACTKALLAAQDAGTAHLILLVVPLLDAGGRELLLSPRNDLVRLHTVSHAT
jgi:hypothetical protein